MRKDLLSLTLALAMGGAISANAGDIVKYTLDSELTLEQAKACQTGFVITDGTSILTNVSNGDPKVSFVPLNQAANGYLYKMEAINIDDVEYQKFYAYNADATGVALGANYSAYGAGGNLSPVSWGDLWVAPELQVNGRDYVNGSCMDITPADGGGYYIKSVGANKHLKNAGVGSEDLSNATVYHFYTILRSIQYTQGTEIGNDGFYNFDLDEKYFETSSNVTYSNGTVTVGAGGGTLTLHLDNSDFRSVTNILNDFTSYDCLSATNIYLGSENKGLWSSSKDNLSVAEERRVNGITRIVYTLTAGTFTINSIKLKGDSKVWNPNADITTFDFNDASNYDLEAGKFTANGGWTFAEPKDFSDYKWLVVTTTYNASAAGDEFRVADADGHSIGGEEYAKGGGVSRGSMWLDRWNNQICATVNLPYLKANGVDITRIASVSFSANQPVSAVYLTNYEAGQAVANTQGWGSFTGDYVRAYDRLAAGEFKYGTIALKYAAAVSGAKVYTVDSWDGSEMTLARHYGVLEAGVPYIYEACDHVGANGDGNSNVHFVRVDANVVSADYSDNATRDNGLIGYYDGGFWPFEQKYTDLNGCYLLSNNELHLINGGEITLGTNRCFFDPAKYQESKGSGSARIRANGNDANAIDAIQATKVLNSDKIYNLNGQEVKTMQKGQIYIMGGMKIRVK